MVEHTAVNGGVVGSSPTGGVWETFVGRKALFFRRREAVDFGPHYEPMYGCANRDAIFGTFTFKPG